MRHERKFLRQCISCKKYKQKKELIRITQNKKTGEVNINNNLLFTGRSAYICKNNECIKIAIKKKRIENSLKSNLPENIKEELSTVLKK